MRSSTSLQFNNSEPCACLASPSHTLYSISPDPVHLPLSVSLASCPALPPPFLPPQPAVSPTHDNSGLQTIRPHPLWLHQKAFHTSISHHFRTQGRLCHTHTLFKTPLSLLWGSEKTSWHSPRHSNNLVPVHLCSLSSRGLRLLGRERRQHTHQGVISRSDNFPAIFF